MSSDACHDTAMILAAGRGERMRPLTDTLPKPLLAVGGKPLIVWHIERLRAAGFTRIIINHAYLGETLERALGNGADWQVSIAYSREGTALETAGGIATALPLIGHEIFPVVNGDVYTEYDFSLLRDALAKLRDAGDLAHLVMVDNPPQHAAGDFVLADGRIEDPNGTDQPRLTFSGIGVYHRALFANTPPGQRAPLAPVLREAIHAGRVGGEHHRGRWTDVGTPERLHQLDETLRNHA